MDFRQYDSAIGRFLSPDRLSELFFDITPYRFAFNNPLFYKDPSGLYEVNAQGNINITNPYEIELFMNFLNHNQKATTKEISNYIFNPDNGFGYDLEEVSIMLGNQNSYDLAAYNISGQIQQSQIWMSGYNGNVSINGHMLNGFDRGFLGADESNMTAGSALTGYAGLHLEKTYSLFKRTAKTSADWASKANALKAAKFTSIAGKSLGALGIALTIRDDLKDGNFGVGDGVRLAIGIATTCFGGPVVVGYAILDIAVGVATGTTLTDRIAAGIENATLGKN